MHGSDIAPTALELQLLTDEQADAALLRELLLEGESPRDRPDDARAVALAEGATVAARSHRSSQRTTKKRTRSRLNEPKRELERLRREVAGLQDVVALLTRRAERHGGQLPQGTTASTGALAVWKSVAARQFQLLRQTERNNQQLRAQVEHQRSIAQGLVRLIQRAQHSFPIEDIPRALPLADAARLSKKRHNLLLTSWIPSDHTDVPPGTLLAQSHAKRLVGSERSSLCDRLWTCGQNSTLSNDRYDLQHVEHSGQDYFLVFLKTFPTTLGPALFRGVGMCARFRTESQDVTVAAGSFWPDETAPQHLQHSGFDLTTWTLAQPHIGSTTVNEVLTSIVCSRSVTHRESASLTRQQANELKAIAGGAHKFLLNQNDQRIDAFMLEESVV